ncbi:MAG: T9SS type A sorting domain-containing protein, partial [Flavobacteriia bacterium]
NLANVNDASTYLITLRKKSTSEIPEINTGNLFSIFPNPSNSDFTIKFKKELTNGELIITNQIGEIVQSYSNLSGNEIKIEKGALSTGIYFVSLKTDKTDTCFQKLILNN